MNFKNISKEKKVIIIILILCVLFFLDILSKKLINSQTPIDMYLVNIISKIFIISFVVYLMSKFNINIFNVKKLSFKIIINTLVPYLLFVIVYNILTKNIVDIFLDFNKELILLIISTILVIPIYEELIYRYLFINIFYNIKYIGVALSSIIFTLAHRSTNFYDLIFYLLSSLYFAYIYIKYDSIELPILMHMLNNTLFIIFILI